jgi:hypothetical protein
MVYNKINNIKNKLYRLDLLFTNWIFIFFLLYILNLSSFNPLLLIIYANLINLIMFLNIILHKSSLFGIIIFIILTILFKLIPLWFLKNTIITSNDIIISFILLFIYLFYVNLNNKNVVKIYYEYIFILSDLNMTDVFLLIGV